MPYCLVAEQGLARHAGSRSAHLLGAGDHFRAAVDDDLTRALHAPTVKAHPSGRDILRSRGDRCCDRIAERDRAPEEELLRETDRAGPGKLRGEQGRDERGAPQLDVGRIDVAHDARN